MAAAAAVIGVLAPLEPALRSFAVSEDSRISKHFGPAPT
jgi:hypothetical protein